MTKANNIYYQICNSAIGKKVISINVKTKTYNSTFIHWDQKPGVNKHRVTSSEMKYLRKIEGKT